MSESGPAPSAGCRPAAHAGGEGAYCAGGPAARRQTAAPCSTRPEAGEAAGRWAACERRGGRGGAARSQHTSACRAAPRQRPSPRPAAASTATGSCAGGGAPCRRKAAAAARSTSTTAAAASTTHTCSAGARVAQVRRRLPGPLRGRPWRGGDQQQQQQGGREAGGGGGARGLSGQ